uniref:uncharacterized protein LOC120341224 n=1 Tax=Styela clava TaxID=7725 RepID=UPI00193A028F|nr:uncharacterized protein LOC120341224 [Styela clava]
MNLSSSDEDYSPRKLALRQLANYTTAACQKMPSLADVKKQRTTLEHLYFMAEKAIADQDLHVLNSVMSSIDDPFAKLVEMYSESISAAPNDGIRLKFENELRNVNKDIDNLFARVREFTHLQNPKTWSSNQCKDSELPDSRRERAESEVVSLSGSIRSKRSYASSKTSICSKGSVHMAKAQVKRERARIALQRTEAKQRIEDEKRKIEHENQILEAKFDLQEAEAEAAVWENLSVVDDAGSSRSSSDIFIRSGVQKEATAVVTSRTVEHEQQPERNVTNQQVVSQSSPIATTKPAVSPKQDVVSSSNDDSVNSGFSQQSADFALNTDSNNEHNISKPLVTDTDKFAQSIARAFGEAMHAPKLEYLTFSGNPIDYYIFKKNFETNIDAKAPTDALKLAFLLHQCKGKAKSLIQHCSIFEPEVGYAKAKDILHKKFGDSDVVTEAFKEQLHRCSNIKPDDHAALQDYALLMRKCVLVLGKLDSLGEMNTSDRIIDFASKLPYSSQKGWERKAVKIKNNTGKKAQIWDLADFIEEEADIAGSNTAKSLNIRRREDKPQQKRQSTRKSTTYTVKTEDVKATSHVQSPAILKCKCCSFSHLLSKCEKFNSKSIEERVKFLKEIGFCFNCLRGGHLVKDCKSQYTCSVKGCGRRHHTLLHLNTKKLENEENANFKKNDDKQSSIQKNVTTAVQANSNACKSSMYTYRNILPVRIRANNVEVETYALVDIGSDTTFCETSLIEELGLTGKQRTVEINTLGQRPVMHDGVVVNLTVASIDDAEEIFIENVMSIDKIPVQPNPIPSEEELKLLPHLQELNLRKIKNKNVSLLIGTDCPYAHHVLEVRTGNKKQPFAQKSPLGWSIIGPSVNMPSTHKIHVNFVKSDMLLEEEIRRTWYTDFEDEIGDLTFPTSKEDRHVLNFLKSSVEHFDGHFTIPLPWRPGTQLPSGSRALAERRLEYLHKRLSKNDDLREKYTEKMQEYITKGFAKKLSQEEDIPAGPVWYLCHHPVCTANKPKVRIVFDCAAIYKGVSLNDTLMPGPDLVSSLIGVLTQFRKGRIALVADIEAMFHQIKVKKEDCNALRFLWWPNGDILKKAELYFMERHIFGACSSPCIASFCLKETGKRFGHEFDKRICEIIENGFYVDDCLTSSDSDEDAINTKTQLCNLMKKGGFNLTKWISNSSTVMANIPESEHTKSVKELDLHEPRKERVLGVFWNVDADAFQFRSTVPKLKTYTRRTILSAVNSLFDPLGMLAPVILVAKMLQQEIIEKGFGWDEVITEDNIKDWDTWFKQLTDLEYISIPRCFKPQEFGNIKHCEIHHFSDASSFGYGVVSYLRLVDENNQIHCSFLCGKAKVAPPRAESIPRLELVAAVLAVKADKWLRLKLNYSDCESVFWTDSSAVRQSICNPRKRFRTFVANRLAKIHRQSKPSQWRQVPSKINPADDASRGLSLKTLINKSRWLLAPEFLWKTEDSWPRNSEDKTDLPDEFQPIERKKVATIIASDIDTIDNFIKSFSDLQRLKIATAWVLRYKSFLRNHNSVTTRNITVEEMQYAEQALVKYVQQQNYKSVIDNLSDKSEIGDRKARHEMKKAEHQC